MVARFVLFRGELFTGFVRLARLFNELFVNRIGEPVGEFGGELLAECGELKLNCCDMQSVN